MKTIMMKHSDKTIHLSQLKGISIYAKNDFYDLASLLIRLEKARVQNEGKEYLTRYTVYGLCRRFASFVNQLYPDEEHVFNIMKKNMIPQNATVEFDEDEDI